MTENKSVLVQISEKARELYFENPERFKSRVANESSVIVEAEVETEIGSTRISLSLYRGRNKDGAYLHGEVQIHESVEPGERPGWGHRTNVDTQLPDGFTRALGRYEIHRDVFGNTKFLDSNSANSTIPDDEALSLLNSVDEDQLRPPKNEGYQPREVEGEKREKLIRLLEAYYS